MAVRCTEADFNMPIHAGAAAVPSGYFAPAVFLAHASPASKTEAFCRRLHLLGKPLFTLPGPKNSALLALGAVAIHPACPPAFWPGFGEKRA